jgi:dienelactone hydrolase
VTGAPDGFTRIDPPAGAAWRWPVLRRGTGSPVVLLHELLGLTPEVVALARRVADDGFTVWLPVLAGPVPADSRADQVRATAQLCVSREIRLFATNRTSPVVEPLRALTDHAARIQHADRAGVIGMCLTGGFALGVATDGRVSAAVAAQPSLPLATPLNRRAARSYGLSPVDVETLGRRRRAGDLAVYVTRFTDDWRCPRRRQDAIERDLGPADGEHLVVDELPSRPGNDFGFAPSDHSVLCVAPTRHPSGPAHERLEQTLRDVLAFLHRRLD